ncbi:hypothetical protein [Treponema pedis]|uniref:hypothetical protein n=1 Tax=Treponema pedis TaxID=409322 RepID=UPI00042A38D1|nr:hypothetical protein [Treponema pedis]
MKNIEEKILTAKNIPFCVHSSFPFFSSSISIKDFRVSKKSDGRKNALKTV